MTPQEFERILTTTLVDHKLSGGERQALAETLRELAPDGQKTAALRSVAFRLAREATGDPQAATVLDWLEDVVKLLHPVLAEPAETVAEAQFSPDDNIAGRIVGLFNAARKAVDVCVFTITDDSISEAILKAHRRGVAIRILTDDEKVYDLGSDVVRLEEAGIPVRVDRTEAHMHHKFALFDRVVLLNGSYNWTRSAGRVNAENVVLTGDRRLIDRFQRYFDASWEKLAH
ncbi:MAG: phospholipase D-like domain-containing protein [Gemmataceae bacterium]